MPKYIVNLVAIASTQVEVEAESGDEAVEAAFDGALPYADAFAGFDLGEWTTASEIFPEQDASDDYEEID